MNQRNSKAQATISSSTLIISVMVLVGILAIGGGYIHHISSVLYIGLSVTLFSSIGGVNHLNGQGRMQRRIQGRYR